MSTLFTFGCSYTMDFNDNLIPAYTQFREFREDKNFPNSWPKLLAKNLNFDLKNYGIGGVGNQVIINNISQKSNEFKKGDIVVIGWTHIERFKWIDYINHCWVNMGPGSFDKKIGYITEDTLLEILHNRTHILQFDDIYYFMNIMDELAKSVGFEVYYWSVEKNLIYNLPKELKRQKKYLCAKHVKEDNSFFNLVYYCGGRRIFEETDNLINDAHQGESGHRVQAELIYNHIMGLPIKIDKLI